jgi:lipopolysaccharide/colanic/teichoic acid biosynthesis glycosyltransferase
MSAESALQVPTDPTVLPLSTGYLPAAGREPHLRIIISTPLNDPLFKTLKRGFDILVSCLVIVLFMSWMYPGIAVVIRLTSRGPVLFRQQRNGLNNVPFVCLKFRTMVTNTDAHSRQATEGDPRVTPVGKFLRKLSLDEMPQFFNVLMGQMSVVGPRPHMISHTEHYAQLIDSYMIRHVVRPGITGLSQVQGYRGETKCPHSMRNRVRLDLFYLRKWTFMIDIRIVIKTAKLILFGDKNAY